MVRGSAFSSCLLSTCREPQADSKPLLSSLLGPREPRTLTLTWQVRGAVTPKLRNPTKQIFTQQLANASFSFSQKLQLGLHQRALTFPACIFYIVVYIGRSFASLHSLTCLSDFSILPVTGQVSNSTVLTAPSCCLPAVYWAV